MNKDCLTGALVAVLMGAPVVPTLAGQLFAYDGVDSLYLIDTSVPLATLVGTDLTGGYNISEIEFLNGVVYASDTGNNTLLHRIDPATGQVLSTLTMSFPAGGDVITSLESVSGTMYAGFTTEGPPGGPSSLVTIDLTTGGVSVVGAMGIATPVGGLAWDGATMYAVSSGGSPGALYTVDVGTGAATLVGPVMVGASNVNMTALEFGSDGLLYGMPPVSSALHDHLLVIDPATGLATDMGLVGNLGLSSLTTVPEPTTLSLLALGALPFFRCRR